MIGKLIYWFFVVVLVACVINGAIIPNFWIVGICLAMLLALLFPNMKPRWKKYRRARRRR
jgi:uncharacterized membrane protein YgaE (UPF0421/DUF939 family)